MRFYYAILLPPVCMCGCWGGGLGSPFASFTKSGPHFAYFTCVPPYGQCNVHERMCNTCAANNCWTAMHEAVAEHGIAPGIVCSAIRSVPVAAPSIVSPASCDPRAVITVSERTRARRATAVGNSAKLHHHTCVCHHRAHLLCERARAHIDYGERLAASVPATVARPPSPLPLRWRIACVWFGCVVRIAWLRVHLFADTSFSYTHTDKRTHTQTDEKWRNM